MNDLALATDIRKWLDRPAIDADVLTASVNGRLDVELQRVFPDAKSVFGEAAVRAVTKTGGCAFCRARAYALVHRLPTPSLGRATRALLGQDPCARCLKATRDELARRVDAGRTTPTRRVKSTPPAGAALHDGPCAECHSYVASARAALTAGAALPALAPHRRRLGATGRVGIAQHTVYGHDIAGVICNCTRCKSQRVRTRGRR